MTADAPKRLRLRPWTVKQGVPFVARVHRRLPRVQGAMWAESVRHDSEVVGVALVGFAARVWSADNEVLCVLRVAVIPGHANACSMLYGACSRMGLASGAENMVTYTHADEHGTSLKASGWVRDDGVTSGGEWGREGRQRELAIDAAGKVRWFAPWGKRAQAILARRNAALECDRVSASAVCMAPLTDPRDFPCGLPVGHTGAHAP